MQLISFCAHSATYHGPMDGSVRMINHRLSAACFFASAISLCFFVLAAPRAARGAEQEKTAAPLPVAREKGQDQQLVSLILWLDAPRQLDRSTIARAAGEAVDQKIPEAQVMGKPPYHVVKAGSGKFVFHESDQPYLGDASAVVRVIDDLKLGAAVRGTKAWIAVNWVGGDAPIDLRQVYQHLGKILAALADEHTLLVYDPALKKMRLFSAEVGRALTSDDPRKIFGAATAEP